MNSLKALIQTRGWQDAKDIFEEHAKKLEDTDIPKTLSAAQYKQNHIAYKKASNEIRDVIKRIEALGQQLDKKEINYK